MTQKVKVEHIHKYIRTDLSTDKSKEYNVYRCILNCSHYIREEFIIGRRSLCHHCGATFTITRYKNSRGKFVKKPICEICWRNKYKVEDKNKAEEILKRIGVI